MQDEAQDKARDDTRGDAASLAAYRVSFTVEYELFIEAPRDASYTTLRNVAEEAYAEGVDWTLVGHSIDDIEAVPRD